MRLRIAYLSPGSDLASPVGSGVEHASARALDAAGWAEVLPVGPLGADLTVPERARGWLRRRLGLPRHAEKYSLGIARRQARRAQRLLAALDAPPDLVLCAFPGPLAFLATDLPVIFYTDATMANVIDAGYRFLDRISARSRAAGQELDRRAFERAHLIGATPDGVPAGVEALGRLAKDDPDDWAAFDRAFRRAHLLVQPSRREPCALVFAEAAAYGLPVVATDVGGIRTAVEPGENGLLVPPEDPEALAAALARASRPESYGDLVDGSRRRHETLLSWPVAAREIGRALGRSGLEVCFPRDDR